MQLQYADAFGQGGTLSGAVGTLSLTDSKRESGYSVSSLFVKYRTQLVGYYWAEVFGKEFPLQFSFNQMDDAASIRAELVDDVCKYLSKQDSSIQVIPNIIQNRSAAVTESGQMISYLVIQVHVMNRWN